MKMCIHAGLQIPPLAKGGRGDLNTSILDLTYDIDKKPTVISFEELGVCGYFFIGQFSNNV